MRTDTQRLDYMLTIVEQQDEEAAGKLGAAYTLGFRGRVMVDAAMGARIIEPGQPMPELTALDLVGAELGRIRNVKGFSEERDDLCIDGELADGAACYLLASPEDPVESGAAPCWWPWSYESWKPSPDDRKKELTKGIALAVCELDRLIRAERRQDEATVDVSQPFDDEQPQPREFKVGDRVKCGEAGYVKLPTPTLGTVEEDRGRGYLVRIDGYPGGTLFYSASELERVDG